MRFYVGKDFVLVFELCCGAGDLHEEFVEYVLYPTVSGGAYTVGNIAECGVVFRESVATFGTVRSIWQATCEHGVSGVDVELS